MIRFIIATAFIGLGLLIFVLSAVGNYRFAFILNRMQVSSNADTLATSAVLAGLIVISGFSVLSGKLIIMMLFMWFANPVASHFLAKTETIVNEKITEECEVVYLDDL